MSLPILFNCQKATLLMERQADGRLPASARVQLWAHLRMCPHCKRYGFQSQYIARQARAAAQAEAGVCLPAGTRLRLQALLDAHEAR